MQRAFFINGGAGRVLCSIPALEHYKQHIDPDVIIVAEGWVELFLSTSLRDNVYPSGHKDLFRHLLRDRELISPEPYRLNAYFNQRVNLIQAFDILINGADETIVSKPINLDVGKNDQIYGHNLVNSVKAQFGKNKALVFQPFGSGVQMEGNFVWDGSGRSFELRDVFRLVEDLSKDYAIILMSPLKIPTEKPMGAAFPENASLLQWMGVIKAADYFLGCDSVGQHIAHALDKPATVVIGSTYPENISYPGNKKFTIVDNAKVTRTYSPYRITPDPTSERHNEDNMILTEDNYKKVVASIKDHLGKPNDIASDTFNVIESSKKFENRQKSIAGGKN
jgi:hypothetical protein